MCFTWSYVSKFRPSVLIETKSNKHSMRTMGPAEVEAPSPHNYLKSHSKEPKSAESEFAWTHKDVPVCNSLLNTLISFSRERMSEGNLSHLRSEEAPRPCQDRRPSWGLSHRERLSTDSKSCTNEAQTCSLSGHQGIQAGPGEFRTCSQVHQEKGWLFSFSQVDVFSSFFFYGAPRMKGFPLCRIMERCLNTFSSAERSSREPRRTLWKTPESSEPWRTCRRTGGRPSWRYLPGNGWRIWTCDQKCLVLACWRCPVSACRAWRRPGISCTTSTSASHWSQRPCLRNPTDSSWKPRWPRWKTTLTSSRGSGPSTSPVRGEANQPRPSVSVLLTVLFCE